MQNINEVATRLGGDDVNLIHTVDSLRRNQETLIVDKDERAKTVLGRQAGVHIMDAMSESRRSDDIVKLGKNRYGSSPSTRTLHERRAGPTHEIF
jgi:hypothetical protein